MPTTPNVVVTSENQGYLRTTDLGRVDVQIAYAAGTTYLINARCTSQSHVFESIAGGNIGHTPTIGSDGFWTDMGLVADLGRITLGLKWVFGILLRADATGGTPNLRMGGRTGPIIYQTAMAANVIVWVPLSGPYPVPMADIFLTQSGPTTSNVETPHIYAHVFASDGWTPRI